MKKILVLGLSLFLLPVIAFAQETAVSLGDAVLSLIDVVRNFKALGTLGAISAIVALLMQFLKTDLVGGFVDKLGSGYKRLILVALGQVAGAATMVAGGASVVDSIITGLIVSGGAAAIYEAIKGLKKD